MYIVIEIRHLIYVDSFTEESEVVNSRQEYESVIPSSDTALYILWSSYLVIPITDSHIHLISVISPAW